MEVDDHEVNIGGDDGEHRRNRWSEAAVSKAGENKSVDEAFLRMTDCGGRNFGQPLTK